MTKVESLTMELAQAKQVARNEARLKAEALVELARLKAALVKVKDIITVALRGVADA